MLTDREIHRLGLPNTADALGVLREWGEAAWTDSLGYRIEALDRTIERARRNGALLAPAAGNVRPLRVSC